MGQLLGKLPYIVNQGILSSKGIFILLSFIVIGVIVDTSFVKVSAYTSGLAPGNISVFIAMAVMFSIGQYIVMAHIKRRNQVRTPHESLWLGRLHKSVSISQYALVSIFAALITQMVTISSYSVLLIEIVIWINYVIAIVLLGILSQRFITWYRFKHTAVVLAYAIATMMICISAIFALVHLTGRFAHSFRPIIEPLSQPHSSYSSVFDIFNGGYVITSIMAFILTWIATVILMHSYSKKVGKAKYWILVIIPLVFFLSQFQFVFLDMFTPFRISEPILFGVVYTVFLAATVPVGGALFGIAFWSVARKIEHDAVKRYMMISAYGVMLLFSSNQFTSLALLPYPPFGLATLSFFGLSSYLVFVGIYSSAISVAVDTELRKSIRRYAIEESKLLDSIGMAQRNKEIEKNIVALMRTNQDKMIKETGIQSSLSEMDMKRYVEQVLRELRDQDGRSSDSTT